MRKFVSLRVAERNCRVCDVQMNAGFHCLALLVLTSLVGAPALSQSAQVTLDDVLKQAQEAQLHKDFHRAAQKYKEAAELNPSADVYEKLGLACFLDNSFPEAIEAFSNAVRTEPERWASQLYLGISLYRTDRFQEALQHIHQALQLNPQENEVRYWLGCTYHGLRNYERAIEHLRVALSRDLENVDILYALTETYLDFSAVLSKRLGPDAPGRNAR